MTEQLPPSENNHSARKPAKGILPLSGLSVASAHAGKVWEVARRSSVTREVLAKSLGHRSTKNGAFLGKITLLRAFGLIETRPNEIYLSEIGLNLVQDGVDDKQSMARRQAVQNVKAYQELIRTFSGTPMPSKDKLASKLRYEYEKTPKDSRLAAGAFLKSLDFADMLAADGSVQMNFLTDSSKDALLNDADPQAGAYIAQTVSKETTEVNDRHTAAISVGSKHPIPSVGYATQASINVSIDLSKYDAPEVLDILHTLGFGHR
ncbi:hypothetical protein GCM10022223_38030 [Kineosporia mesophila]|uniref:Transcriptional regulator n=1 Tax=Kineosporia mesophila TaxID=566012 RepID=A0ABP6ZVC4_9ACTN|nr:hypothetical protein [Kineosporia mesophila]MCD5349775.1 hypothetical protein [Kineosporia mesophila]